jgi:glycerate kinase
MKIVVAMDSFKGSMSSVEAGEAVEVGIFRAHPQAEVVVLPLADGGEGTVAALTPYLAGELQHAEVTGPIGVPVIAEYGYVKDQQLAVIEIASAAGMTLLPAGLIKTPLKASTYGVGELIRAALKCGARHFLIGLGGSATNDGGVGMLDALGYEFLDDSGHRILGGAAGLGEIASISDAHVVPELAACTFSLASDVSNPLLGERGATYTFGEQKGVTTAIMSNLDAAMGHYARMAADFTGIDASEVHGAGAAGGLGFAFLTFLGGTLMRGVDLVLDTIDVNAHLHGADYLITGEGRLDVQTTLGKAPLGVARRAARHGCKVIAVAGNVEEIDEHVDAQRQLYEAGIHAYFPIVRKPSSLEEATDRAVAISNLSHTVEQIFRLLG